MTLKTSFPFRLKRMLRKVPARMGAPSLLLAYDGGLASVAALRQACEMAGPGTVITAAFLDVVSPGETLEQRRCDHAMHAQAILAAALTNARMYGKAIETLHVPCYSKGAALLALAAERKNVTLLLGVQESDTTAPLDPFVDYVLSFAPGKVVMVGTNTLEPLV